MFGLSHIVLTCVWALHIQRLIVSHSLFDCFTLLHSREEVAEVYHTPLLDLVYKAASVHRMYNDPQMVRV